MTTDEFEQFTKKNKEFCVIANELARNYYRDNINRIRHSKGLGTIVKNTYFYGMVAGYSLAKSQLEIAKEAGE